jgi:hypothetical protein
MFRLISLQIPGDFRLITCAEFPCFLQKPLPAFLCAAGMLFNFTFIYYCHLISVCQALARQSFFSIFYFQQSAGAGSQRALFSAPVAVTVVSAPSTAESETTPAEGITFHLKGVAFSGLSVARSFCVLPIFNSNVVL